LRWETGLKVRWWTDLQARQSFSICENAAGDAV
jgi:hypothetical protein